MRWVGLLMLLAVVVPGALPCNGADSGDSENGRLVDDFDGTLALDWKQIRPDADHQSLTKNPGKLTIATQFGSIHLTGRPELAKNLFLLDISLRDEPDFVATTCLESFRPITPWHQAGLIVYGDDDNYLKFVVQYGTPGKADLNALAETDGQSTITKFKVPLEPSRLWLRVIKRGDHYECSTSNDGETFTPYADIAWGRGNPRHVGIVAKNGNSSRARTIDAVFDSFELRGLTAEEASDFGPAQRARLLGTWNVTAGYLNGKKMAEPGVTSVAVAPNEIAFTEKSRKLVGSYAVADGSLPKRLTLFARSGTVLTPLNFIYSLDENELTLCVVPKADADPPKKLEPEEGDGLLILQLERAAVDE